MSGIRIDMGCERCEVWCEVRIRCGFEYAGLGMRGVYESL